MLTVQGAHCPQELLLLGVRWAETSLLRSRHGAELRAERGVPVDHATIERGGVPYSPLLAAACHRRTRSVWGSWRRDETSPRAKASGTPWRALWRRPGRPVPAS
jgi:putative transposase